MPGGGAEMGWGGCRYRKRTLAVMARGGPADRRAQGRVPAPDGPKAGQWCGGGWGWGLYCIAQWPFARLAGARSVRSSGCYRHGEAGEATEALSDCRAGQAAGGAQLSPAQPGPLSWEMTPNTPPGAIPARSAVPAYLGRRAVCESGLEPRENPANPNRLRKTSIILTPVNSRGF